MVTASLGISFLTSPGASAKEEEEKRALCPDQWKAFKLADIQKINHNTSVFRFELPEPSQVAGLTVASCLLTKAKVGAEGKPVIRPYTPISKPDAKGHLDLLVKVYPEGKMSKYIGDMKVGDVLEMKGPIPKYPYRPCEKKEIGMIAGGTGITPMLQVIDEILDNPKDTTKMSLLFANLTEKDILLKEKLDSYAKNHPEKFKVYYVLDKAPWFWSGGSGYVTKQMLKEKMPDPTNDNLVFVCGPPGMMKVISGEKAPDKSQGELKGYLKELGFTEGQVYKF